MLARRALLLGTASIAAVCLPVTAQTPARAPARFGAKPPAPNLVGGARLELLASFPDRQITGITVSRQNRVFVCLPRWTLDVPVSVAELVGGELRAFPDESWNGWRNTRPQDADNRFVCTQSVVVDPHDDLWVLDPASPAMSGPVERGPKLVRIDLSTNRVKRSFALGPAVAPPGSYLNDMRFSRDGKTIFITDSGVRGAIVVVNAESGAARRVLDGHPSTQAEAEVVPRSDGRELRRADGRTFQAGADGIAISADGSQLYWQALTGRTLYRAPTAALADASVTGERLSTQVQRVAQTHPADGLWIDASDRLYVSNFETGAVEVASAPGAALTELVRDPRLRWPDTFAQGPDGTLYVTASYIQDSPWFKRDVRVTPSSVWRIVQG